MECEKRNDYCKNETVHGRKKNIKLDIEELETMLGPDDIDVDFRRFLEEARDENGCPIFETFSTGAS